MAEAPGAQAMGYILGKAEGEGTSWHGHVTAVTVAPDFRQGHGLGLGVQVLEQVQCWVSFTGTSGGFAAVPGCCSRQCSRRLGEGRMQELVQPSSKAGRRVAAAPTPRWPSSAATAATAAAAAAAAAAPAPRAGSRASRGG
jgi:hypothetical protein